MGSLFDRHRLSLTLLLSVLVGVLITVLTLAAVCQNDQVLVPGKSGYSVTGKFEVGGTLPLRGTRTVRLRSKEIVLWGSWAGDDQYTGTLTSPAFKAPAILGLFVAGQPNNPHMAVSVQQVDTGETFRLQMGQVGESWKELRWLLPISWYNRPIRLVAVDGNQEPYGWFGISSPLRISLFRFVTSQLQSLILLPAYLIYFALFFIPGLLLANVLIHRWHLDSALTVMLAIVINSVFGYLAFWIYWLNNISGIVASVTFLIGTLAALVLIQRRQGLRVSQMSVDVIIPTLLILVVGLAYTSTLYMLDPETRPETIAQIRFFDVFPPDNVLPKMFADKLYGGQDPRPLFGDWLSSDRPPLQAGIILLQRPFTFLSGTQGGLHYQILSTIVQCSWIAALWALCRTMRLSGRQIAIVLTFSIFSGFFLFNSVYVWPKLLAGALGVFAFTLLLKPISESRRPLTVEIGLAAAAVGLGMLAHGGVVFTLPAIALLVCRPRQFPGIRQILIGILILAIFLAPWSAYQKLYEPPGNRLVKWHLAGVIDSDSRSSFQTIRDSYSRLTFNQIIANKWENLTTLLEKPIAINETAIAARQHEFFFTFRGLGILNLGWLLWLITLMVRQLNRRGDRNNNRSFLNNDPLQPSHPLSAEDTGQYHHRKAGQKGTQFLFVSSNLFRIKRVPYTGQKQKGILHVHAILGTSLISLLFWIMLMFGPDTTVIHHGSYATMMLLFVGLGAVLSQLPRLICYILLTCHVILFLITWVVAPSVNSSVSLVVAPNVWMVSLAVASTIAIMKLLTQIHDKTNLQLS